MRPNWVKAEDSRNKVRKKPESILWLLKKNKNKTYIVLEVYLKCLFLISFGSFIDSVILFAFSFYPIVKNSLTSWRSTVASRRWGWRSPRTRTRWAPRSARRWRLGPTLCPLPRRTAPPTTPPPGAAAWTRRRGSAVRTAPGTNPGSGGRRPHGNDSLCCPGDQWFGTRPPLP